MKPASVGFVLVELFETWPVPNQAAVWSVPVAIFQTWPVLHQFAVGWSEMVAVQRLSASVCLAEVRCRVVILDSRTVRLRPDGPAGISR